jgi:hypothetical protein
LFSPPTGSEEVWCARRAALLPSTHPSLYSFAFREKTRRSNTVFISFRLAEALERALQLKEALNAVGVSAYVCETRHGDNLVTEISHAIANCELAIILGSETFGEKTDGHYSTWEELTFIKDEQKPIFMIKMCERFKHPEVRFCFPKDILHFRWDPGMAMPDDLVEEILDKMAFPNVTKPPRLPQRVSQGVRERSGSC